MAKTVCFARTERTHELLQALAQVPRRALACLVTYAATYCLRRYLPHCKADIRHICSPYSRMLPMATMHFQPDEGVEDISAADLEQIRKWNKTIPPTVEACVHHLIEEKVREQPDDEAVCSRDGSLSYRKLDGYANMLASRLVLHGIKPDDLVPMCFEKSMWTVVAMLAVLKAGAAFVPVPCSPVQRIKTILCLIRPTVFLTSARQASILGDMSEHVIIVGKDSFDKTEGARLESLEVNIRPSNLAYVLFTSGSTGTPKVIQSDCYLQTTLDQEHY